jgi:cell division control protein 24
MGTQKDKKDKKDKKEMSKNAKLLLKGRIFMTNVTEVLSLGKQGITSPELVRLSI